MYYRVPVELQASLVRDIKRGRLRSFILIYPVAVLFFGALAALCLVAEGHWLLERLQHSLQDHLSKVEFWGLLTGAVLFLVGVGMFFLLWLMYRECSIEQHLFCARCQATDGDDEGFCPMCRESLSEHAGFFDTSYDDEKKHVARLGLIPYRSAPLSVTVD